MKDKIFYLLSVCVILCFLTPLCLYAHPGHTDSKGGHTNRETGEYHYHHGNPAHQHEDGICPYDFVDNKKESSYSASKNKTYDNFESNNIKKENVEKSNFDKVIKIIANIAIGVLSFFLPYFIVQVLAWILKFICFLFGNK